VETELIPQPLLLKKRRGGERAMIQTPPSLPKRGTEGEFGMRN